MVYKIFEKDDESVRKIRESVKERIAQSQELDEGIGDTLRSAANTVKDFVVRIAKKGGRLFKGNVEEKEITLDELRELMKKGEVEFQYVKKDGTIRNAKGTLKSDYIPKKNRPALRNYKKSDNVFCYYDLDAKDWRSFIIGNLKNAKY